MRALGPIAALLVIGSGWGLTIPFTKIAVSTGHQPLGLVFWDLLICTVVLGGLTYGRGARLELEARHLKLYFVIALVGTILPNAVSYKAAAHLPAGVMALIISMVPMFAFPIALMMGTDRFSARRMLGLAIGLTGVALLVGPEASLPERAMAAFIPLALIAPFFYGIEGNYVAKYGTQGLSPIGTLFGASLVGALITLPLALGLGQWVNPVPFGLPETAFVASALIHALVYSGYVWLVGRAGAVFAAQVSYLVTIFGVVWSMLLLSEAYSPYIWAALALMMAGMFLVQPRDEEALA